MWNKQTRIGKHSKAHKTKNQSIIHFKEEVMNAILEQLSKFGVVPVVVLNEVKMQSRWQKHYVREDFPVRR